MSIPICKRLDAKDLVLRLEAASSSDVLSGVALYLLRETGLVSMQDQSDGMRALTAMTFHDLSHSAANIIAIDEPEIHLHPSSQRALANLFQAGSNQKILATHSPFIVQKFDADCIIAITPEKECRQLMPGSLTTEEKLLAQWWTSPRLEPLTARHVVFVEGVSDRLIIEAAAKSFGCDLDRIGISLFELGGAGEFKHSYRLFGASGFNVSCFGLVDMDHEAKWTKWCGLTDPKGLEHAGFYVCRKDLEEEYVHACSANLLGPVLVASNLFSEREILGGTGAADLSLISDSSFATFLTSGDSNRKVRASMAVSQVITAAHVSKMPGLGALLARLKAL